MPFYKITKLERKKLKDGRDIIKATVRDTVDTGIEHDDVTIWPDYPNFQALDVGYTTEGDIVEKKNGNFVNKSLYPARTNTLGPKKGNGAINKAMETKKQNIAEAQENKNENVRLSATFRDATNLTVVWAQNQTAKGVELNAFQIQQEWKNWRKWLTENFDDVTTE